MQEIWLRIKLVFSFFGGAVSALVGGMDSLMTVLLACMILDYLTGVMHAVLEKQLSSAIGFKGICKKVLIVLMVGAAHMMDQHITGGSGALRSAVICFYLSNEGISMLENAARIGLPIPETLRNILVQLTEEK
ncbi:MAG: phage holin family protein [Clostridia bacterium]|nr:phage holin family protein [Clostridia bacterium]